jgi:hypothetical protein
MPALHFWFSQATIYVAGAFVFMVVVGLIGIKDMVSRKIFYVFWVIAVILAAMAWGTAAKQDEDNHKQAGIIKELQAKVSSTDGAVRQIASTLGITTYITPEELADRLRQKQASDRAALMGKLRTQYILSHSGITPELAAGNAWPPQDWVNAELEKLGEDWRVSVAGPRYEFRDVNTENK